MTTAAARAERSLVVVGLAAAAVAVAVGLALAIDIRLGVALALAVVVTPLALLDLPAVIGLWAAVTMFSRAPGFGLATSGVGLLIVGAWIAHLRADRASIRAALRLHARFLGLLALLLAWLTISLAWSRDQALATSALRDWYVNAAALVILLTSVRTSRDVLVVAGGLMLGVLAALCLALAGIDLAPAQPAPGLAPDGRLAGVLGDPNFMAALFVPVLVLCAGIRGVVDKRARWLLIPAALLLLVGLAMTQSRGGVLAALTAFAAAVVFMRGRRAAVLAIGAAALLTAAVYFSANPAVLERLQAIGQDRGNGREDLWLVARRMSEDQPVTGVGLANFTVRSREYVRRPGALRYVELVVERPHEVHNTYLQMLAETGVVGLLLFLALAWTAVTSALRAGCTFERTGRRRLAVASRSVAVASIGLLAAAVFLSLQANATVWVLLALGPLMLGVACSRRGERAGG